MDPLGHAADMNNEILHKTGNTFPYLLCSVLVDIFFFKFKRYVCDVAKRIDYCKTTAVRQQHLSRTAIIAHPF